MQRDDHIAAQALRGQAKEVVNFIVAHTSTADLRESFMSRPEVQAILS